MTEYCIICETEPIEMKGWVQRKDGEWICSWCVKDMINSNETVETFHGVWIKNEKV